MEELLGVTLPGAAKRTGAFPTAAPAAVLVGAPKRIGVGVPVAVALGAAPNRTGELPVTVLAAVLPGAPKRIGLVGAAVGNGAPNRIGFPEPDELGALLLEAAGGGAPKRMEVEVEAPKVKPEAWVGAAPGLGLLQQAQACSSALFTTKHTSHFHWPGLGWKRSRKAAVAASSFGAAALTGAGEGLVGATTPPFGRSVVQAIQALSESLLVT